MKFKEPFKLYTAETNVEAHMIVNMLVANGVEAYADEDNSGVSLWALGVLSQFHQPNVWIERSTTPKAVELIRGFEEQKREREQPAASESELYVECESCKNVLAFPASLNGTTQDCPHCRAYVDVGEFEWDVDFGEPGE